MTGKFKKYLGRCTDRRTMKIVRFQKELSCCLACSIRQRRCYYHVGSFRQKSKLPSWKLVSKNRKQWMEKPLKIEYKQHRWSGEISSKLVW